MPITAPTRFIVIACVLPLGGPAYTMRGLALDAGNEISPGVASLLDALVDPDEEPLLSFSFSDLEGTFALQAELDAWVFTAGHREGSSGDVTRTDDVGPSSGIAVFTEFPGLAAFALSLPIIVGCQDVVLTLGGNLVLMDIDGDSFEFAVNGQWESIQIGAWFVGTLSDIQVNMDGNGIFEGADGTGFSMLDFPPMENLEGQVLAMTVPGWFIDENGEMTGFEGSNVLSIGVIMPSDTPAPGLFSSGSNTDGQDSGTLDTLAPQDCNDNGVPDACEVPPLCPSCSDCNANGIPDECEPDADGDQVIDVCDPCPLDYLDDSDGDGACDSDDECPSDPNKIVEGQCGCGNPEDDDDEDGVANCVDQCPDADDRVFAPNCVGAVPTVSAWGLIMLTLLLLVVGKIHSSRPVQDLPQV